MKEEKELNNQYNVICIYDDKRTLKEILMEYLTDRLNDVYH